MLDFYEKFIEPENNKLKNMLESPFDDILAAEMPLCEDGTCTNQARYEYRKGEDGPYDGVMTYYSYRCELHPVDDLDYDRVPL